MSTDYRTGQTVLTRGGRRASIVSFDLDQDGTPVPGTCRLQFTDGSELDKYPVGMLRRVD